MVALERMYTLYTLVCSDYWIKQEEEAVETKGKTSKNMFKSEKDFLEFMLKYQQVLSERDSGN